MNKSDYLMSLYDALEGLPPQTKADTMSEYQEHFRTELAKGRTEENIITSLGDPISLANVIRNRMEYSTGSTKKHARSRRPSLWTFISWIITAIIIMGVISGITLAVNITKNGGWSNMVFGIGTQYNVDELKEVDWNSATRIEINVVSAETTVFSTNSSKVKAALTGQVKTMNPDSVPTLEVTRSGDVISIIEERKDKNIFGIYSGNLKMDISIPESFDGDIVFKGISGGFTTSNLNIRSLLLKLTSGGITLTKIALGEELSVSSISGNIKIEGLEARTATIRSTSGTREFIDFSVSGDVQINSVSGKTSVEDIRCSIISVDSTSGNITIKELDGAARINATSGNIEVFSDAPKGEFNLSTISGKIKLSLSSNSGFSLKARNTSGSIRCDFDLDNESSDKRHLQGIHGSGEIPVTVKATSGSIQILKSR